MATPPPAGTGRDRTDRGGQSGDRERARDDLCAERDAATDGQRAEPTELARLRERVAELETALQRKERELDAVRQQYEAVLQGRDGDRTDEMTWRTNGERRTDGDDQSARCVATAAANDGGERAEPSRAGGGGLLSRLR